MTTNYTIDTPAELNAIGEEIAKDLEQRGVRIVILDGEMGAGKTTLMTAIGKAWGVKDTINSPTFAIVNEYESERMGGMYHFDFYRVKDVREVMDFGGEEYFDSGRWCFIEWADVAERLLPDRRVVIHIEVSPDGKRILTVKDEA